MPRDVQVVLAAQPSAKQAAIKLATSQLQAQGLRVSTQELHARADALLAQRPELLEQAMARVWAWTVEAQQARLHEALFDHDGRKSRPVGQTGSAKTVTEIAALFAQLRGDLRCC